MCQFLEEKNISNIPDIYLNRECDNFFFKKNSNKFFF